MFIILFQTTIAYQCKVRLFIIVCSYILHLSDSLFISISEHFSEGFEWLINTFALKGANLEELKSN